MGRIFFQVDAFTAKPFAGNPAAVFVLDKPADVEWMQLVAREMNLSETAFVEPRSDGSFSLRWFTPAVEVDLCGHATLAAAHVLWQTNRLPPDQTIRFHTRSGELRATRAGDWIELNFPALSLSDVTIADLDDALGAKPLRVMRSRMDALVELPREADVRSLRPDFTKLKSIDARGVIVTAHSEAAPFDFISRFFAPRVGVDEDPVTGSAHCALGPYWSTKRGKTDLLAFQASTRGGVLRVGVRNDRILLGGQAVTIFRGEML